MELTIEPRSSVDVSESTSPVLEAALNPGKGKINTNVDNSIQVRELPTISFEALLSSSDSLFFIVQGVLCRVPVDKRSSLSLLSVDSCHGELPDSITLQYSLKSGFLGIYRDSQLIAQLAPGERI